MKKRIIAGLVVAMAGALAGCSGSAASLEDEDFGSEDSQVTASETRLAGTYLNTQGDGFASDGLYKLELRADKTFTAERQAPPNIRCVRAPCTVQFTGKWSANSATSRLSLRHSEDVRGLRRFTIALASDGGPISFTDRTTAAQFSMGPVRPAAAHMLTLGTFNLFGEVPGDPRKPLVGSCVRYTEMSVRRGFTGVQAHLEDRVGAFGSDQITCRLAVNPAPRDYFLSFESESCGSTTWVGATNSRAIKITDHTARTCEDLRFSKIEVEEDGVRRVTWPVEQFDGTLRKSVGIGGENTGTSLATSGGLMELVLTDAQRNQFVDGRNARVVGERRTLNGVETANRPAIGVIDLLVCPEPGQTLNCMPGPNVRLSNLCSPENQPWVADKCEGVTIAQ